MYHTTSLCLWPQFPVFKHRDTDFNRFVELKRFGSGRRVCNAGRLCRMVKRQPSKKRKHHTYLGNIVLALQDCVQISNRTPITPLFFDAMIDRKEEIAATTPLIQRSSCTNMGIYTHLRRWSNSSRRAALSAVSSSRCSFPSISLIRAASSLICCAMAVVQR